MNSQSGGLSVLASSNLLRKWLDQRVPPELEILRGFCLLFGVAPRAAQAQPHGRPSHVNVGERDAR